MIYDLCVRILLLALVACTPRAGGGDPDTVRDVATIPLDGASELRVPENATIVSGGHGQIVATMVKTIAFAGHPPRPVTIEGGRRLMGVATKLDGHLLVIATFGEWDSHIEGGASLALQLEIPATCPWQRQPDLAGENSIAQGTDRDDADPMSDPLTYWYAPTKPAVSWTAYPGHP